MIANQRDDGFNCTKNELLNDGLNLTNLCPNCEGLGTQCFVESHPAAVLTTNASAILIKLNDQMRELNNQLQNMRILQHQILCRLPDETIKFDLTPTDASESTKDKLYLEALEILNLVYPFPSDDVYECTSSQNDIVFAWDWCDKMEIVASGQHLHNKELFFHNFFALKKRENKNILYTGSVHGRTDLVVLNSPFIQRSYITRNMVRFDIEIIPPGEINIASGLSRCLRECVTQLLGLNCGNINNSPSMVLTDLTQNFFCVYLVLEQRKPVKFSIKVQTCLKLASALHLAGLKGDYLQEDYRPICYNFARSPYQS